MSFDYFVAVHKDKWPTAQAVQTSLEKLGYPLVLNSTPDLPFSIAGGAFSLQVVFEGCPIVLEADIEQAADANDAESLFGGIAAHVRSNFLISNGDYFLILTFRSDADQIRAGLYLAAAMILSFDGYGFENQYETHGGADFAHQLLAEASDATAFEN